MTLIKCDECGKQVSDKAIVCPHCGAPVDKIKCEECGKTFSDNLKACPHCGAPIEIKKPEVNNDSSYPELNLLAPFGLILSILSIFLHIIALFSIVFSWVALVQIRDSKNTQRGEGLAITGMVISSLMLLVIAFNIVYGNV